MDGEAGLDFGGHLYGAVHYSETSWTEHLWDRMPDENFFSVNVQASSFWMVTFSPTSSSSDELDLIKLFKGEGWKSKVSGAGY